MSFEGRCPMGDCPKCGLADPGAVDFCPNPQCRAYLGWASAAPSAGLLKEASSTMPAEPVIVTGPKGDASLQTTMTQAQQSGQSLDELNLLGGSGLSGDTVAGAAMLDNTASATAPSLPDGPLGIPGVMLDAYQRVERTMAQTQPGCHLSWTTLAGIGEIESGHASGGRVDAAGNTIGSILGPQLDGSPGMAAIADTDQGTLDADPGWDRAVGPMQFIPASWQSYGAGSPHNIYDSTLAAGRYLCAGGTDLSDPAQQAVALFRYNHSSAYVANVLRWTAGYRTGVFPTPSEQGSVPQATDSGTLVVLAAGTTPTAATSAAPVVANLDQPAVTNLSQPAVTNLDQPAVTNLDAG
ncbi:MAG: lytic transglycosylase [Actinobacteria bacterium]|nr:lytic transglycosylase [Actinomycetota bacterium]